VKTDRDGVVRASDTECEGLALAHRRQVVGQTHLELQPGSLDLAVDDPFFI